MSERKNVSISGMASLKGGIYGDISLSGSSRIDGDTDGEKISVAGSASINGNLDAKKVSISGSGKVDGYVKCEEIILSGTFKCTKNVECEFFSCSGVFNISDMLNAENIRIEIGSKCSTSEIGCQSINVKRGSDRGFLRGIFGIKKIGIYEPKLIVDIIEGDEVNLENTIAKIVRGKNVTIGEGCDIQVVEYIENISVSDKANIKEKNKI